MRVITSLEAEAVKDGFYHILREGETRSLCGTVEADDQPAEQVGEVFSRKEAEERGLQPCEHCLTYAGQQQ